MNDRLRIKTLTVTVALACGFTAVSGRLIYLQICCHEKYRLEALQAQERVIPIPAPRGRILDCQQRVFAQSVPVVDLYLDGELAAQDGSQLDEVAALAGLSPSALRGMVNPLKRNMPLARELPPSAQERLRALKYRPLILAERVKRVYPNGREASHVIGFTNQHEEGRDDWSYKISSEYGAAGAELMLNSYLAGAAGERRIFRDKLGREIPAYRRPITDPRNGCDVTLTLDQVIQHAVEEEADKLVEKYAPETLSIIVTRPATGEILAMVSRPTFDPNDRGTMTQPERLKNRAIGDIYEPGSTFKIVTLSAVLSEGLATLDTPIYCENGSFLYAGATITDTHPGGSLTVRRALEVSSNIAFAKLGLALREENLYRQVRAFGFGDFAQDPGARLALAGEEKGLLRPTARWSKLSLTHIPIGYEIGVTNLQMTMAMGAVANGGNLMRPLLVKTVTDSDGRVVREFQPLTVRRVIPPDIAADIRGALKGVVSDEGTAEGAKVQGFTAAGKTGTAKKYNDRLKGYEHGAYYSSFIGFVPVEQPQFLISILVNQPRGQVYGGKVAGPAFSAIADKVALQLNMIADHQTQVLAKGGTP